MLAYPSHVYRREKNTDVAYVDNDVNAGCGVPGLLGHVQNSPTLFANLSRIAAFTRIDFCPIKEILTHTNFCFLISDFEVSLDKSSTRVVIFLTYSLLLTSAVPWPR